MRRTSLTAVTAPAVVAALVACAGGQSRQPAVESDFDLAGRITAGAIREASGLARSTSNNRLWLINDGGSRPQLHAIDLDGNYHGAVTLTGARNVDWEDLTSFAEDGKHWLVIADVGDNNARRDYCVLYIVEEPGNAAIAAGAIPVKRRILFRYPDGARDAESVAFDVTEKQLLILSKRDIPAVLYSIPLAPQSEEILTATRIGEIDGIPQPTAHDIERAVPDLNWHWQPNAMSIAANGETAAILTYRAAYVFTRERGQTWFDALRMEPKRYALGQYKEAEAVVFSNSGTQLYVTTEKRNAPLLQLELRHKVATGDPNE